MNTARKFTFDTIFDVPEEPEEAVQKEEAALAEPEAEEAEEIPSFRGEDMEAARAEGHAAGREEGIREALQATEQRIEECLKVIQGKFDGLFLAQEESSAEMMRTASSVAVVVARKLFPRLNRENGLAEVEHLVDSVANRIMEEPKVKIHVNDGLAEALSDRIDSLKAGRSHQGEVMVSGDPDIALGDCLIEWTTGGIERNSAALWREIDNIVDRNLENPLADAAATTADLDSGDTVEAVHEDGIAAEAPGEEAGPAMDEAAAPVEGTPPEIGDDAPMDHGDEIAAGGCDDDGPDNNSPPAEAPVNVASP